MDKADRKNISAAELNLRAGIRGIRGIRSPPAFAHSAYSERNLPPLKAAHATLRL